jgi:hypothetical protein
MGNLSQPLLQMTNSFAVRRAGGQFFARFVPVAYGFFVAPRLRVVVSDDLGMRFRHFGKTLLKQLAHPLVVGFALGFG